MKSNKYQQQRSKLLEEKCSPTNFLTKITYNKPFHSYRRFLMPLQQTAFCKHRDKRGNCSNEQFLLFPQCIPPLVIGHPFNYRDFLYFDKICSKSSAAELLYEGKRERINTLPHTTNWQQMTLKSSRQYY